MKWKTTFLKAAVFFIGIIVLVLCIFLVPWMAEEMAKTYPKYAYLKVPVLLGVYLTMIPFFLALYQSAKLLSYIEKKIPFTERTVAALRHIKYYGIAIMVCDVLGLLFLFSQDAVQPGVFLLGFSVIFGSIVISVFAAILQELIRSALAIKEENDLTV
ncbi:DUF2975 domain-containing protein [Lentibacillus amyloliquefaciens]|uniref:DUF2975 domain-containing protein n=1 Tax=Lentibacillus amyloliquefaciens TaxID=1472767 RepID=A0A0U4ECL4_9BACI|nr:hypothetical protein AOX59_06470 [Lentibacillus amyloliquefaciens]